MADHAEHDDRFQHVSYAGPTHDTHTFIVPRPKDSGAQSSQPSQQDTKPQQQQKQQQQQQQQSQPPEPSLNVAPNFSHNRSASPNPPIAIPRIEPMTSGESPAALARGLAGRYVDEFGNVLDWDGTVLGRVKGDLPSMVGRAVKESGEVLDSDNEVAGHVSENHVRPALKPLQGGLKVDDKGNIYDDEDQVIGRLNKPKDETHPNAKPASAPSPSEVYLDVKSTHDGIQLIIKIPTVFNRDHDKKKHKNTMMTMKPI